MSARLRPKIGVFHFDSQWRNMFEFIRCSKNDVWVRFMFNEMIFDSSLLRILEGTNTFLRKQKRFEKWAERRINFIHQNKQTAFWTAVPRFLRFSENVWNSSGNWTMDINRYHLARTKIACYLHRLLFDCDGRIILHFTVYRLGYLNFGKCTKNVFFFLGFGYCYINDVAFEKMVCFQERSWNAPIS